MSRIDDIEALTNTLAATTIGTLPKRCSYIRSWNSKCRHCSNACKHEALKRSIGRFVVEDALCVNCGACVSACPTSALITTSPNQTEIVRQARTCAQNFGNVACFTCAKEAEALNIDTGKVVVLPCLNYLDEYLIVGLFACGIKNVALLCRSCKDCDIDGDTPYFRTMVKSAKGVLASWQIEGKVKIFKEIPENLCLSRGKKGAHYARSERRDAFTQTGGSLMNYAMDSIGKVIAPDEVRKKNRPVKVVVKEGDVFPADSYRSVRLLAMLDRVGTRPYGQPVESRFWGSAVIDPEICNRCGQCAKSCVPNALAYVQQETDNVHEQKLMPGTLTFTPSLCMRCNLCADVCRKKAITISPRVMADDLDSDVTKVLFEDMRPRAATKVH